MMDEAATRQNYHHGDLRQALLNAAEEELAEKGIEGFSLRGCARRAGVSHAAPAHHFGDVNGLLTALAIVGTERFYEAMRREQADAAPDPRSQYVASGIGYVEFALANPALFKLMFESERPDKNSAELRTVSRRSFMVLVDGVAALRGENPMESAEGMLQIAASWSMVHGIASLLIANAMHFMDPIISRDRKAMIAAMIGRMLP